MKDKSEEKGKKKDEKEKEEESERERKRPTFRMRKVQSTVESFGPQSHHNIQRHIDPYNPRR